MKEREMLNGRRAITPVVSALILSAVVLTIGGVVWAFSQGAMTISAEDYAGSVIEMTDTISERFIIEHVYYELDVVPELHVFVYNYGTVAIEVKVEVKGKTYPDTTEAWIEIPSKEMIPFPTIDLETIPLQKEELNIKTYTKRGNNAYYRYLVP